GRRCAGTSAPGRPRNPASPPEARSVTLPADSPLDARSDARLGRTAGLTFNRLARRGVVALQGDDDALNGSIALREALTRRLLASADAVAAIGALWIVVAALGVSGVGYAGVAAIPLVIVLHKLAGLYDRDELVLRRSTLDEVPQLLQITALYALAWALIADTV